MSRLIFAIGPTYVRLAPEQAPRRENLACDIGTEIGRVAVAHVQVVRDQRRRRKSKLVLNTRLTAGLPRNGGRHDGRERQHWTNDRLVPCLSSRREKVSLADREGTALESGAEPDRAPHVDAAAEADRRLAELYRSESPKLVRMFSRRTRDRDEADDLTQDVFHRFARLREQAFGLDKPAAYLRRIAANLLKDRAKTAARHNLQLHVVADETLLPGIDPVQALESRDMLRRLEAAMLKLKPRTREIFMAHRIEGLSYSEIAERTGLSVKGVEKQMSKAIHQLDRLLHRDRAG